MSFVTTQPEEMTAAASNLQGIGSAMAVQNAAAAASTTDLMPAAADEVSALQAAQFSAYGNLYQSVSAQATAIHQMFVNILGTSAGSYGTTEAANQVSASSTGLSGLLGGLTGSSSSSSGASGILSSLTGSSGIFGSGGLSSNLGNIGNIGVGNYASATSDMLGLAGGGLLDDSFFAGGGEVLGADGLGAGLGGTVLAGAFGPAGATGFGGAPMLASAGQASSVGGLSVPQSWAGAPGPAVSPVAETLTGSGWTTPAPGGTPATTMPAGMPAMASAGRGGGLGAPRYGLKPKVIPRPSIV